MFRCIISGTDTWPGCSWSLNIYIELCLSWSCKKTALQLMSFFLAFPFLFLQRIRCWEVRSKGRRMPRKRAASIQAPERIRKKGAQKEEQNLLEGTGPKKQKWKKGREQQWDLSIFTRDCCICSIELVSGFFHCLLAFHDYWPAEKRFHCKRPRAC